MIIDVDKDKIIFLVQEDNKIVAVFESNKYAYEFTYSNPSLKCFSTLLRVDDIIRKDLQLKENMYKVLHNKLGVHI